MKFESANPSVVRSIKQRVLLNAWLRARRQPAPLPAIGDFRLDEVADELSDMISYDVEGRGDSARFRITQEGLTLATTYGLGNTNRRINRYLDDVIGPERYARAAPCYRTLLARQRPTYSISLVQDADGKDVTFERLLLPFGRADHVEQIIGSFKAISVDGGFRIDNLMGIRPKAIPVRMVNAVIDLDFVPSRPSHRPSDDVVELS
jgi:hypothetical protein